MMQCEATGAHSGDVSIDEHGIRVMDGAFKVALGGGDHRSLLRGVQSIAQSFMKPV